MAAERTFTVRLLGDASGAQKAFKGLNDSAAESEGAISKFSSGVSGAMKIVGGALAGAAVVGGFKSAISAATDLAETQSKVGVLFGDAAGQVEKFASGAASSLGQTRQQAMDAAATFATFGKSAGLSGTELASFSTGFTGLASDLASFNNTSPQEAIDAIGAALRGEAEPMRKFGVLLDDASMREEALRLGLIKTTKDALTPQQKVLAAQALIYKQTGAAQGDFARTSDGLANRQRILSAQFQNVKTQIGSALLPAALAISGVLLDKVMPAFQKVGDGVGQFLDAFRNFRKLGEWEAHGPFEKFGVLAAKALAFVQTAIGQFLDAFRNFRKLGEWEAHGPFEKLGVVAAQVFGWLQTNVPPAMEAVRNATQVAFAWLAENVPPVLEAIRAATEVAFSWLVENVPPALEAIRNAISVAIQAIADWWRTHWEDIRAVVEFVFNTVRTIIETTLSFIQTLWATFGSTILRYAQETFHNIMQVVQGALDMIRGIMDIVMGLIRGDWGRVWDGLKQIVDGFWQILNGLVDQALNVLRTIVQLGLDALGLIFSTAWDAIKSVAGAAFDALKGAVSAGIDATVEFVKSLPRRYIDALGDLSRLLYDIGKAILEGLWNGLKDKWDDVAGWVGGLGSKIKGLKGPIETDRVLLVDEGYAIIQGLETGMLTKWGDVETTLSDMGAIVNEQVAEATDRLSSSAAPGLSELGDTFNAAAGRVETTAGRIVSTMQTTAQAVGDQVVAMNDWLSRIGTSLNGTPVGDIAAATKWDPYAAFPAGSELDIANQKAFAAEQLKHPGMVWNWNTDQWETPLITPPGPIYDAPTGDYGGYSTGVTVNVTQNIGTVSSTDTGDWAAQAAATQVSRELYVLLRGAVA